jgi:hypothetical protein
MEHKKLSEIGVARNLISELASLPSGQIFSLDALLTQTATGEAIVTAGHRLIAVKLSSAHSRSHARINPSNSNCN